MFDNVEKSLIDRIGTGAFLAVFASFLFTVIFQSYVTLNTNFHFLVLL